MPRGPSDRQGCTTLSCMDGRLQAVCTYVHEPADLSPRRRGISRTPVDRCEGAVGPRSVGFAALVPGWYHPQVQMAR
jgi:hypothetical protein